MKYAIANFLPLHGGCYGRGRWEGGKKGEGSKGKGRGKVKGKGEKKSFSLLQLQHKLEYKASVPVVRISSHLVRGLSIFLYSSEVFSRLVDCNQWLWILKDEGREDGRKGGRGRGRVREREREGGRGNGGRETERRMVKHPCQLPSL